MKIETFNPYVIKILISLRKEDSISSISKRINLSYGWTNKWVNELIKEGILKGKWRGGVLQEGNESYKRILKFIKENLNDINFYYSVLNLLGIEYCFTKNDAVYIWTEGRYNIARYKEYYPVFIIIKKENEIFEILQKFIDSNMDFIVVGGYAVSAFKHRFSVDADIVIKSQYLSKFESILRKEGFKKTITKELENVYS